MMRCLPIVLALAACAAPVGPSNAPDDDFAAGLAGRADDGAAVVETSLGTVHEGRITAAPKKIDSLEDAAGHLGVYKLALEAGQPFAAIVERIDGDVDPYLVIAGPEGTGFRLHADQQGLLPMSEEDDALVVATAPATGTYVVIAGDRDNDSDGAYRLRLIGLSESSLVDLDVKPPDARTARPTSGAAGACAFRRRPARSATSSRSSKKPSRAAIWWSSRPAVRPFGLTSSCAGAGCE